MSVISVGILQTQTINQSGTDSINFVGAGTLDVTGIAGTPITVDLSQVAGAGVLDTINISNAVVTLGGVAGVSALTQYNITADSELVLSSSVSLAAGSAIEFVAAGSRLVFGSGVDFSLIGSITGFGYGSSIDVAPAAASLLYAANPGMNTGGVITLLNSGGQAVDTVTLNTGSFTSSSFMLSHDSSGGTIIGFYGVTLVTASPMTADLDAGKTVTFNVGTNDNVTVAGGTPTLSLSDGGTATYDAAASTPTNLVFAYTVAAGQNAADLSITGYALNGATVTDSIGNPFDLSPAVVNPPGILQIDTTAPTIAGVTTSPGSGDLGVGQSVTFTVVTSKAVTVSGGTPTLTLSDGGTATYAPAASTSTALAFTYTVASGQNAADLSVTGAALNGATIADAAGNAADLSGAVVNPPGILQIDTTAPTIAGVTTSPGSGDLGVGQSVAFTVATSKAVTVSGGTPTLTLSDGGTATYAPAASTSTALAFTYTVASGQNAADLSVTGSALNGATIADAAGNAADLSGAVVNPPGILQIDTTAPTIAGVTTSPGSGDLGVGQSVTFTVATSKAVTVSGGTPTLTLSDGGTATYAPAASTSTALAFTYTVASGQNAADLSVTGSALNGATIADAAGNAADLGPVLSTPVDPVQIDGIAPTVTAVTTSPSPGDIDAGQQITFTIGSSKPVSVIGTPTLDLNNGGIASYDVAASSPSSLVFDYTLPSGSPVPGKETGDLSITGALLNGGTIKDSAGNPLAINAAAGDPPAVRNFAILNTNSNDAFYTAGDAYTGPVQGLQHQYINITPDNLDITALVPNSFIHSGSGEDAIDVSGVGGTNVLDGSTGSNFLVGGSGNDTFFIDDRGATAQTWSTVSNFHTNDAVTLYGITPADFSFTWTDNQGAVGYTGLTLRALPPSGPTVMVTLAGFATPDLSNGKLSVSFGTDQASQSNYMYIRAN